MECVIGVGNIWAGKVDLNVRTDEVGYIGYQYYIHSVNTLQGDVLPPIGQWDIYSPLPLPSIFYGCIRTFPLLFHRDGDGEGD